MNTSCLSCDIVSGNTATVGGVIIETESFHAHQDFAYAIPGLVIVASKRHFKMLDEMNEVESAEFLPLIQQIRRAQREVLKVEHSYYFYNEDTKHHFHLWMVPRYEWMAQFGKSIQAVRPAMMHARDVLDRDKQERFSAEAANQLHNYLNNRG